MITVGYWCKNTEWLMFCITYCLEGESQGAEIKLPPRVEAERTNAAPAPSFLVQTSRNFIDHGCLRIFCNWYNFNPISQVKKVIFKVFYETIWSRGCSRSRNSDLRVHGAGAERNIFGSATLLETRNLFWSWDMRFLFINFENASSKYFYSVQWERKVFVIR